MNRSELVSKLELLYVGDRNALEELITCYDELQQSVENLKSENYKLNEKLESLQQDVEENYKRIPVNEQYEIYDHDFI